MPPKVVEIDIRQYERGFFLGYQKRGQYFAVMIGDKLVHSNIHEVNDAHERYYKDQLMDDYAMVYDISTLRRQP